MWLSGLSAGLPTEKWPLGFPEHKPGLPYAGSPAGGGQEATDRCISSTWSFSPSPPSSLPLSLKINKLNIKKIKNECINNNEWQHN